MTLWVAWALLLSGMVVLAGCALEGIVAARRLPRRIVWFVAMAIAAFTPAALALRQMPSAAPAPIAELAPRSLQMNRTPPATASRLTSAATRIRRADPFVAELWLGASLALLLAYGTAAARLLWRRSTWEEARIDGHRVSVSQDVGPAVIGFVHPRIVVPGWARAFERDSRRLLLLHEQEHILAGDSRALLCAGILLVLFPWNGALWWMVRRLRTAIEMDCDARVIRSTGRARDYGLMLITVAERHTWPLPLALSLVEPGVCLEQRIHAIAAPSRRRPPYVAASLWLTALLAMTGAARAPRPDPLLREPASAFSSLVGSVTDRRGSPITGAMVTVDGSQLVTAATVDGRYRITGLHAGEFAVTVRGIGFLPLRRRLTVSGGETTANFALQETLRKLDPMVTMATRPRP